LQYAGFDHWSCRCDSNAGKQNIFSVLFFSYYIFILIAVFNSLENMQNWSHLNTVVEQLNHTPSKQHGTDVMRIRQWYVLISYYNHALKLVSRKCSEIEVSGLGQKSQDFLVLLNVTKWERNCCFISFSTKCPPFLTISGKSIMHLNLYGIKQNQNSLLC